MYKVNDHITNSLCESYWTVSTVAYSYSKSISKYSGKWFDLSLNSSYWIKLFFSLKITADLRCPFKPLTSEFTPMLPAPSATLGNPKEQHTEYEKAACSSDMTEGFGFRWSEFKLWLLFCLTYWMVSVILLPYILVLM